MIQNSVLLIDTPIDHQILRWPTPSSKTWTLSLLETAQYDTNIIAIVAAGSAVRPNVASMDLDLLVICKDVTALRLKPPIEIDLRTYPETQVEGLLQTGHDLLNWAVKFGKVLFESDGYWWKLITRWQHRLPLPSARVARERAAATARHLSNVMQSGDIDAAREQALSYMTHIARAELVDRGVYPASRPELPKQLEMIGSWKLAEALDRLLVSDPLNISEINALTKDVA